MHTATIVTTVQLIDAMSPALGMIQNAQALVAQGFLKIRNAAVRAAVRAEIRTEAGAVPAADRTARQSNGIL